MSILLFFSAIIFTIGLVVTVVKRHAIMILLGIELMLNAANLNLVVFGRAGKIDGQLFALFIILVAVCEAAVGMALVLQMYRHYHTSLPDQMKELKES